MFLLDTDILSELEKSNPDHAIAVEFGETQAKNVPPPSLGTLIAATAITRRLTWVTHNTKDMSPTSAVILDPWRAKT